MKRVIISLTIALVAIGYFLVSPFVGLAHLRSAIDARNASALSERIDFKRLRNSLGQQIISTYLKITGKSAQLGPLGTSIAAGVGASIADPLLADLVNPEMMLDLLSGGGISATSLQMPGLGPFSKDAARVRLGDFHQYRVRNWKFLYQSADASRCHRPVSAETSSPPVELEINRCRSAGACARGAS